MSEKRHIVVPDQPNFRPDKSRVGAHFVPPIPHQQLPLTDGHIASADIAAEPQPSERRLTVVPPQLNFRPDRSRVGARPISTQYERWPLTDTQRVTAGVVAERERIEALFSHAEQNIVSLRQDALNEGVIPDTKPKRRRDKQLILRRVGGIIDALNGGEQAVADRPDSAVVMQIADNMKPSFNEDKANILDKARFLDAEAEADELLGTKVYSKRLPRNLAKPLQEHMGIKYSEGFWRSFGRYISVGAGSNVLTWAETTVGAATGAALVKFTPAETYPLAALVPGVLATYGLWFASLKQGLKENFKVLVETGKSQKFMSKVFYDISRKVTKNEKWQKLASVVGFFTTDLKFEAFALGAIVANKTDAPTMAVLLAGLNLGAMSFQFSMIPISRKYREWEGNKLRDKVIDKQLKKLKAGKDGI